MAKLGNYIEQIRGVSYKPEDVCASTDVDAVAILRANNIQDDGLIFDDLVYVKKDKVSAKQYIQKGDIVVCASSGSKNLVGKAAIVNEDMEISFGAFCKVIRPKKLMPSYIGHYFQSPKYRNKISELAGGANINNIRNEHIDDLDIVVPNTDEQERISIELNKVGGLISLRKQQLSKLDELVKSRFIELFGDPISNPLGWPVKRLDDISVLITNGNTPKGGSDNYVSEGIVFLRSQNVWRNKIDLDDVAYIDAATHADMAKSSLHDKDILITKTGRINTENSSLGRAALFRGADNSANINGHVYLVRLDGTTVPEYVVAILTGEPYRRYIRKVCVGGIDKRQINLDQVEDFPIILPPMKLQEQFAAFVEQTDKSKFEIQKSLEKLETLKKALMQKYFG